jgi:hypothetical protein
MAVADGQGIAVRDLAIKILTGVEAHWEAAVEANPDVVPLPERRLIGPGNPSLIAWDCAQLVVSLEGVGQGPAPSVQNIAPQVAANAAVMSVRHAIFSIQLVRCTPPIPEGRNQNPYPLTADLHAAGLIYMDDAGYLSQALVHLVGQLKQGLERGALVEAGVINTLGPAGGLHAVEATLAITSGELR